ncbi:MAG: dihydrodipicolinate synthase family protein [Pseudomonadota bacterium]|jgi:4-hydroxy-tetrahydrodipicolinate synthase
MDKPLKLRGLYPAPSVPFGADHAILEPEFARHLAAMGTIAGLGGVAVNGHQGEMLALSRREQVRLVALARDALPPDKHVISGVLGSAIEDSVEQLRELRAAGADAALVLPPFDYMPRRILARSRDAVVGYFKALSERVDLPLVIFQYPHATGSWYDTETMDRLADIPSVVGVKHAIRHLELYAEQWAVLRGRISVLAARDAPGLLAKMLVGADGSCIGISNIAPALWARFTSQCLEGQFEPARDLFMRHLLPLVSHVWSERVPRRVSYSATTKEALVQLGVFSSARVRPPELDANLAERERVTEGLRRAGLLPVGQSFDGWGRGS